MARAVDALSLLLTGAVEGEQGSCSCWPELLAVAVALERRNVEKPGNIDTQDEIMESRAAPEWGGFMLFLPRW